MQVVDKLQNVTWNTLNHSYNPCHDPRILNNPSVPYSYSSVVKNNNIHEETNIMVFFPDSPIIWPFVAVLLIKLWYFEFCGVFLYLIMDFPFFDFSILLFHQWHEYTKKGNSVRGGEIRMKDRVWQENRGKETKSDKLSKETGVCPEAGAEWTEIKQQFRIPGVCVGLFKLPPLLES